MAVVTEKENAPLLFYSFNPFPYTPYSFLHVCESIIDSKGFSLSVHNLSEILGRNRGGYGP